MLKYRHVNGIGTEAPHADKEAAQEWSSAPGSQPPYAAISSDETLASDDPRTEKAAACGSAARAGTNKNRYLNIADVRRRHRSTASKPSAMAYHSRNATPVENSNCVTSSCAAGTIRLVHNIRGCRDIGKMGIFDAVLQF